LIRSADIRTSTGKTNRLIVKLYPLEVQADISDSSQNKEAQNETRISIPARPPRRAAASKATEQISEWTKILCAAPEDVGK